MKHIGEGDPTFEQLKNLTFTDMFIKEGRFFYFLFFMFVCLFILVVLRLNTPVPQNNIRYANEAKEIDGITIPANVRTQLF
jgi:hypothetical protein